MYAIRSYYGDCSKDLVIPATINGKAITEIAPSAFKDAGIVGVDFSKATNLVTIGESYNFV